MRGPIRIMVRFHGRRPWDSASQLEPGAQFTQDGGVLPEQFANSPDFTSEQRLMAAVLEDGLQCYAKGKVEAQRWVHAEDTAYPYSFVNICAGLNISASYVRRLLAQAEAA